MAFQTVSWQPDDELVSEKMDQMSQNEQWLYDNVVTGSYVNGRNTSSAPMNGHGIGGGTVHKVCAMYYGFDTVSATTSFDVILPYPEVFRSVPHISLTVQSNLSTPMVVRIKESSTTEFRAVIHFADLRSAVMTGGIHVIIVGQ